MIYHILNRQAWEAAQAQGQYKPQAFEADGFIHCSDLNQLLGVANRFYAGEKELLVLCIAEGKTDLELRYENLEGGEELFPHLYGALKLDAVVETLAFETDAQGVFHLPPGLS